VAATPGRTSLVPEPVLPANLSLSSIPSASGIPRPVWQRLGPAGDPFLNADYLTILERHGAAAAAAGWTPCHLLATAAEQKRDI